MSEHGQKPKPRERNEIDPKVMADIELKCREIGHIIADVINTKELQKKYGFCMMVFAFEGPEFTYISNAERDSMIATLKEFQVHLQRNK